MSYKLLTSYLFVALILCHGMGPISTHAQDLRDHARFKTEEMLSRPAYRGYHALKKEDRAIGVEIRRLTDGTELLALTPAQYTVNLLLTLLEKDEINARWYCRHIREQSRQGQKDALHANSITSNMVTALLDKTDWFPRSAEAIRGYSSARDHLIRSIALANNHGSLGPRDFERMADKILALAIHMGYDPADFDHEWRVRWHGRLEKIGYERAVRNVFEINKIRLDWGFFLLPGHSKVNHKNEARSFEHDPLFHVIEQ